jgi:two-component system, chemotaxis family, CheB/CheR fusion protein
MADVPLSASTAQAERLHRFAHDIRNRLAGMHQVLQQLVPTGSEPEQSELFSFAEQQYFKALREVEHLLDDLAVDRSSRMNITTGLDLGQLVRTALADQRHRFDRKDQQVVATIPDGLTVQGDVHYLGDLCRALLSNASKFTQRGGTIRIELEHKRDNALLRVVDNGVGLELADLEKVFERYAWLNSRSTAGEAQGRGTLARARQWAAAHNGQLDAQSAGHGKGCTFTLTLPLTGS